MFWTDDAPEGLTVKIWDASSGKCLQTLSISSAIFHISFDTTGSYIHASIGTIAIDASSNSNMTPKVINPQKSAISRLGFQTER
jgi:hypothetical protein